MRLILDLLAVGLLIACLASWWLDNLSHEIFGSAFFTLVIVHNVFNRRWYGSVGRGRRDARRIFNLVTVACLVIATLLMLVTSVLISRDVFAFMALDAAFAIREIHMFASYWFLLIIAVHLGTRWQVVMNICRTTFGIAAANPVRTLVLRLASFTIALWGVKSCFEMAFGSKLMLTYSLDMWDFNASTLGFFVNYGAIVGLMAIITHYLLMVPRRR